jgi:uncharacterized damage-inducible protein DinB
MKKTKWFEREFYLGLPDDELQQLLNRLADTPDRILNLVSNLSDELMSKKPNGKWSIKENIGHLVDLEELHSNRIDDFIEDRKNLRQADLQNKKTENAGHNIKTIDQLIIELKKVRGEFISRINNLDSKVLNRKAIHPRLNQPMRPVDMVYFIAEHDDHHIETIKEIIEKYSSS